MISRSGPVSIPRFHAGSSGHGRRNAPFDRIGGRSVTPCLTSRNSRRSGNCREAYAATMRRRVPRASPTPPTADAPSTRSRPRPRSIPVPRVREDRACRRGSMTMSFHAYSAPRVPGLFSAPMCQRPPYPASSDPSAVPAASVSRPDPGTRMRYAVPMSIVGCTTSVRSVSHVTRVVEDIAEHHAHGDAVRRRPPRAEIETVSERSGRPDLAADEFGGGSEFDSRARPVARKPDEPRSRCSRNTSPSTGRGRYPVPAAASDRAARSRRRRGCYRRRRGTG